MQKTDQGKQSRFLTCYTVVESRLSLVRNAVPFWGVVGGSTPTNVACRWCRSHAMFRVVTMHLKAYCLLRQR